MARWSQYWTHVAPIYIDAYATLCDPACRNTHSLEFKSKVTINIRSLPISLLFSLVVSYSWIKQLSIIENRVFVGSNGYSRGYVDRTTPGFSDGMMTYQLPLLQDPGRTRINGLDILYAPTQRIANQTEGFPRLAAPPGSYVAMKYLGNRHVTLP